MHAGRTLLTSLLGLACASAPVAASAQDSAAAPVVTHYDITNSYSTSSQRPNGSGSSSGTTAYREAVRTEADGCRTRSFDLVDDPEQKRPLAIWQFPLVLRECPGVTPELTSRAAMLARRDAFLAAMGVGMETCGKRYFTWNVFEIECDPDAAVRGLAGIDLAAIRLEDGAEYVLPDTSTRVTLRQKGDAPPGQRVFTASGSVDSAFLRDRAAKGIMVVAEVSGEIVTREEALARIAGHQFSGESAITLVEEPAAGRIIATLTGEVREVDAEGMVETRRGEIVTTRQRAEAAPGSDPSQFPAS